MITINIGPTKSLVIMKFPERKKLGLGIREKNHIKKLATFDSEETANEFLDIIKMINKSNIYRIWGD